MIRVGVVLRGLIKPLSNTSSTTAHSRMRTLSNFYSTSSLSARMHTVTGENALKEVFSQTTRLDGLCPLSAYRD
eukprot:2982527-Rhodomonas_salina.1